jgi:hypothetical protein
VYHALFAYSGDVQLASEYLANRGVGCSVPPWTPQEDEALMEAQHIDGGIQKFVARKGKDIVQRRMDFLDQAAKA